jgi:serine/threonine-protein kinase
MVGAATVLLLGAAAYGWSLAAGDRSTPSGTTKNAVLPQPSVVPASGKCVVSYAVRKDENKQFDATVTVANRDKTAIRNWNLWFIMQGDQKVTGIGGFKVSQENTAVTVQSSRELSPQKSVTMNLTGQYSKSNAAPMVFQLGGQSCETYVSGKPGAPSRPVQRLSNGQVRLGPPVTSSRPGLFIPPGGGPVIPVPTDTSTPPDEEPTDPVTTDPTDVETLDPCDASPRPPSCDGEVEPDPEDSPTVEPTVSDPGPIPSDDTDPVDTNPDPEGGAGSGGNNAPPSLP